MFLRKVVLKICSKLTGEHPCRSVISIKLQNNFQSRMIFKSYINTFLNFSKSKEQSEAATGCSVRKVALRNFAKST